MLLLGKKQHRRCEIMVERMDACFLKPRRGDIIADKIILLNLKSLLFEFYNVASTRLLLVHQPILLQ